MKYLVPNNLGVVTYFGASVVKIAGLQQACISEVLLIDNRGADIGVMIRKRSRHLQHYDGTQV